MVRIAVHGSQSFIFEEGIDRGDYIEAIPGSVLCEDPDDGSWNTTFRSKFLRPLYQVIRYNIEETDEELFCIYEQQKLV